MARPTKVVKRSRKYTVRFTVTEEVVLKKSASNFGISVSELIRVKAANISIKPIMNESEVKAYLNLVGIANNLNQLTKSSNQGVVFIEEIKHTLKLINEIFEKVK